MKLFLAIATAVIFFASTAYAGGFADNPDRYPSIGISFGGFSLDGSSKLTGGGLTDSQDLVIAGGDFTIDTRIPVSNSFTVMALISFLSSESDYSETPILFGGGEDLIGTAIRIGVRYYFNQ